MVSVDIKHHVYLLTVVNTWLGLCCTGFYSNAHCPIFSHVGLWLTFSQIVLSHNCVVIFYKILDKTEAQINPASKKIMPAFCTRWHCFSNTILAGVVVDHFCLLSNQQDKTFLQNEFLINPKSSKYLTDKSDKKQYEFLCSLGIILTGICFHTSFFKIIIIYIIFCAEDSKTIFASHLR